MKRLIFILMLAVVGINTMNVVEAQTAIDSGTCGENLTWVLTNDSTLIINGNGDMENYNYGAAPWFDYLCFIHTVIIEEGVKTIGSHAFEISIDIMHPNDGIEVVFCSNLTSVKIPNSVTHIREYAFSCCSNLTSIIIPNNVFAICQGAFNNCSNLTSVTIGNSVIHILDNVFTYCIGLTSITIPNTVKSIGKYVFLNCKNLTSITIPDSVKFIGDRAFEGCSNLIAINVESNNKNFASENGVLFNKNKNHLICCPYGKSGDYTIPKSVKTIGNMAFAYGSGLTSITVPNSVNSIGDNAFYGCRSNIIIIGDSLTSIGERAFANSRLNSITIGKDIKTIGKSAFFECYNLTSITIHALIPPLLDGWEFTWIPTTAVLTVPVGAIPAYRAVAGWNRLKNVIELGMVYDPKIVTVFDSGTCGENLTWLLAKDGILTINGSGDMVDYNYSNTNPWCFYNVRTVIIGDSVSSIGRWAFCGCKATSIIIGNSVTTIRFGAFMSCVNLTSIDIPKSVTNIDTTAFWYSYNLNSINVESGNMNYASENGVLFNKAKTILIKYPEGKIDTSYSIPKNVTTIECYAFMLSRLMSVEIPKNVKIIGDYAFQDCGSLTSVKISKSVKVIGDYAFASCGFNSMKISKRVKIIGKGIFDNVPTSLPR